jgi:surface protein
LPSNITDISFMFWDCTNFNQPLSAWDTSNVTNMSEMFGYCTNFNQPLTTWNTSNVKNMHNMFDVCIIFGLKVAILIIMFSNIFIL